jgi:hypothetical protein
MEVREPRWQETCNAGEPGRAKRRPRRGRRPALTRSESLVADDEIRVARGKQERYPRECLGCSGSALTRCIAALVIHRKISLGTQSNNGERFAERALSAAATCRLQSRSLFTYLSELITAHARGDPFPALT